MRVLHVSQWRLPVQLYGGSQRIAYWLPKAQALLGLCVTVLAPSGTTCPGTRVIEVPKGAAFAGFVPDDIDVAHFHGSRWLDVKVPSLITVHGNSPDEIVYLPTKVYVSRDHARRAGSKAFVHNGVDPEDYIYRDRKDDYFLFLDKVGRRVKGVDTALRLARQLGVRLVVAGGTRFGLRKTAGFWDSIRADVHFCGQVGGREKAELLAGARALLHPARFEDPCPVSVLEALMSGTPVIASARGSLPELVTPDVGFVCHDDSEMEDAIRRVGEVSPAACRQRALDHFSSAVCARKYLDYYEQLRNGQPLGG